MSDYVKSTNFAIKDDLVTTDPSKIVKGTELDNEFNALSNAISSKANTNSPALTGTPTAPTATTGSNTTQLATTAYVKQEITALGTLGTMATQNKGAVDITGGTIVGITDLTVADGGTGRSTLTDKAVLIGAGTGPINSVAPGTSGNVLKSDGTNWVSAPSAISSGSGGLSNGTNFTITTGSSGVALITVEFMTNGNSAQGTATGYLAINGSNVAEKSTQTMEYSYRYSGCGGTILYRLVGSANTNYTGTFSYGGSGNLQSASYIYMGI